MYKGRKVFAVVLAAGSGKRMKSQIKKQFMELLGKPVFMYSLIAFDANVSVDEIVVVSNESDLDYIRKEAEDYGIKKKLHYTAGGKERYNSVYNALKLIDEVEDRADSVPSADGDSVSSGFGGENNEGCTQTGQEKLVLIHDSARPMLDENIINRSIEEAYTYHAAVAGMPVKDTIKTVSEDGFVTGTPDRSTLYLVQTPQAFEFSLILEAYTKLIDMEDRGELSIQITDDAMVAEHMMHSQVHIFEGSYENIKLTTPDDIKAAENFLVK